MTLSTGLAEGDILWQPSDTQKRGTRLAQYEHWLAEHRGLNFSGDYQALLQWSNQQSDDFWNSIWEYFEVKAQGSREPVVANRSMPGAQWYPNVQINYAEHVFRHAHPTRPALISRREDAPTREIGWAQLERETASLAAQLRLWGIAPGDRVASYLPNWHETVVAFLACASIGAIWSSCSPDMGASVVLDRFQQIEPKILLATDSYQYAGKVHDRREVVAGLLAGLPSVQQVIHVPGVADAQVGQVNWGQVNWRNTTEWSAASAHVADLRFDPLPFSHPLWIVYSSGTTGMPKAMVHGHGGIVLTHLKAIGLHHDIHPGDRMLFLGGTGWIVWNLLIGSLLMGGTAVLYDGNPAWPRNETLWEFIDEQKVSAFGCGAALLINSMKQQVRPRELVALESLRSIFSTGSPLPMDAYRWVYDSVKADLWLASISGGTDIAAGFVVGAPTLPVTAGEIQCIELGVDACAMNEAGQVVVGEVGELVIRQPMPSMPLYFWNDAQGKRYHDSYFELFPGLWRHGDWIRFTERGTSVIYGRSDSTINRMGIRMGTAEIYRVVEEMEEVLDSLVVDLEYLGRPSYMPLFVVLKEGVQLDASLKERIAKQISTRASARHIPNEMFQVAEIPRTLTGKKMEVPVRKLLLGLPAANVASTDAMANPASLQFFIKLAEQLNKKG
jgi:acetoacetyl-CoA synthetase